MVYGVSDVVDAGGGLCGSVCGLSVVAAAAAGGSGCGSVGGAVGTPWV